MDSGLNCDLLPKLSHPLGPFESGRDADRYSHILLLGLRSSTSL
jgi:hypothetical protein